MSTDPIQMVLSQLHEVTELPSGGWRARCPAHDDHTPSLTVNVGKDGRVLLHCHAGCDPVEVVHGLGLQWRDLFPPKANKEQIVATYDYVDEAGTVRYQVVRLDPKGFRQRHPCRAGRDGWTWNLGGKGDQCTCPRFERVLYRLPEVKKAAASGAVVWVVEGERDADRLASLGLTATTNVGGAGKWKRGYNESLRGAHVIVLPDHDPPGHEHAQQVARHLHGVAASLRVVDLPGLPEHGDVSAWLSGGHDVRELMELVKSSPAWTPLQAHTSGPRDASTGSPDAADPEPVVIIVREALNAVTEEGIAALAAAKVPVYVRSRMLVTVARDGTPQHRWLQRPPGSPVIVPLDKEQVQALLDGAAVWMRVGKRGSLEDARPPEWVAAQILHRLEWPFPYLEAVTEVPTIRPAGTVLDTPGWDQGSGLLYEPMPGITWPAIPEKPSTEEVRAAIATLLDPVREFPFVAGSDRAAYVAAVLTLLARHTIAGPVPLFAVRAPTPATGKGLLVSVIAHLGTGRPAAVSSLTDEAAEWRKLLLTVAMEGAPMVLLDNLTGAVGSNHLAAALTATEWMDRQLGVNKIVRAPLVTVWFATGNNLSFKRTLGRRVIPIDLDARVERPEDRHFERDDLVGHVQTHRAAYVVAALTLLRAYHAAGRPRHHAGPRMGSFEAWDDRIRGAVLWLGLDDPASSDEDKGRGRIRADSDADVEQHGTLLEALAAAFPGGQWFTVQEVMTRMQAGEGGLTERRQGHGLKAAVEMVVPVGKNGVVSPQGLGSVLRSLRDRVVDGRVLRCRKQRGGQSMRWAVMEAGA